MKKLENMKKEETKKGIKVVEIVYLALAAIGLVSLIFGIFKRK